MLLLHAIVAIILSAKFNSSTCCSQTGKAYCAVLIVPTGIGAKIGGYAGDAIPTARVISSVVDTLITHPNVMNGASLYWTQPNILYVEGYALDQFCAGRWGLLPVTQGSNRVGLILDCELDNEMRLRHIQVAEAARATLGVNVECFVVTEEPIGVAIEIGESGASWGTVKNIDTVLAASRKLVEQSNCNAIAIVSHFPDDLCDDSMHQNYIEGKGVDPVGGAEAIISHLIVREFGIPAAHSPSMKPSAANASVFPQACAEELGYTFLPCVLANLHKAPALVLSQDDPLAHQALWAKDVNALIVPASAMGGPGTLRFIGVEENTTVMRVTAADLGMKNVVNVRSYLEAVGLLACHKAGVLPECLTGSLNCIKELK